MPRSDDDDRDSRIFEARASGRSKREVAREFGLTIKAVDEITKAKVEELQSGAAIRESIGFAAHRLERAEIKLHLRAMEGDGDAAAEMVAIKANERRMTMLGGNAPIGHAVQISTAAAPRELTSTEQAFGALDAVLGITARERELANKDMHREPMTVEEIEELEGYRRERDARQDAEREKTRAEREARLAERRGGLQ
jgi:hypothetical protein